MVLSPLAIESDEQAYARYKQQGDRGALDGLVERWHAPAFRLACCICRDQALAEEAVQNAFLKLLSPQASFTCRGQGSFRAWFLSLVTNCARMARRAEYRAQARKQIDPCEFFQRKGYERSLAPDPVGEEERAAVWQAFQEIEKIWRTPLVLHFLDGISQKELAARLQISQQMVSRRIGRGLALLRARLPHG